MSCPYSRLDGSYVLGGLSPQERLDFERHLSGCPDCARGVQEVAGLPGLLSQVDPGTLGAGEDPPPVPPTLLPDLARRVARSRRRRGVVALAAASVAGLALAAGAAGLATGRLTIGPVGPVGPGGTATAAPAARAMTVVEQSPVEAAVALAGVAWGTQIDLTCSYAAGGGYTGSADVYSLVVKTRQGAADQVASWHGLKGKTFHIRAATATRRADIAEVQLRDADGDVVS
jgi:Putative zinc-finger